MQRGPFGHGYQPWNPGKNNFKLSCPTPQHLKPQLCSAINEQSLSLFEFYWWGVTAIYAKILHDPGLQESQKKFWLFKHNFRALDLTWSDYVIVNKSTWVWELHNCQLTLITNLIKLSWKSQKRQYFCTCKALFTCFYFLLWMKSTKCRNIADCNIFALLWIIALSWSNIFASKLRMLPFFMFQEENLCHD